MIIQCFHAQFQTNAGRTAVSRNLQNSRSRCTFANQANAVVLTQMALLSRVQTRHLGQSAPADIKLAYDAVLPFASDEHSFRDFLSRTRLPHAHHSKLESPDRNCAIAVPIGATDAFNNRSTSAARCSWHFCLQARKNNY